jgi:RecJ-like exonuclease
MGQVRQRAVVRASTVGQLRATAPMSEPPDTGTPGEVTCPVCDGTGTIMNGARECPDCGGSGKALPEELNSAPSSGVFMTRMP